MNNETLNEACIGDLTALEARAIHEGERNQANSVREGVTLFQQLEFARSLEQREQDPTYTFRKHLRSIGGEIEE